ncbi:restriction endonuclease [Janthinobacterium sp. MP5059B]|uniref:restriction endonuclease n=1 Tax=Janthinobacterium sp. MP5059B TaxID=1766683 RepID=UPI000893AAEE|nr:restriction endonuclease [Janthinobacterium sp. MP5059B]OEZ46509.1 restriction endonuclease [Janthinobacterium sp. MP5059B]
MNLIVKQWSDNDLELEIKNIQSEVQRWAKKRDLWRDCAFTSCLNHHDSEPEEPYYITLLVIDGSDFYNVLNGGDSGRYEIEFRKLLNRLGYHYENLDGVTIGIYAEGDELCEAFGRYFHWKWVCSLINEDTADVYEELYGHFANRPDDLHRLEWREFEVLLFRIFQNQGFEAILGPGRADGGIDIRLWQKAPLGDILTFVQAKKYALKNKIGLTDVAALYGISEVEEADKSLFVTTSSYLPGARNFSIRTRGKLKLAERADVINWCAKANAGVIADKSSLVSSHAVSRIVKDVAKKRDARLVHASTGVTMVLNAFALVIKESKHAALLMMLGKKIVNHDGYQQEGTEVPVLDHTSIGLLKAESVHRAKRIIRNGRVSYWDGKNLYTPWNGEPEHFSWLD